MKPTRTLSTAATPLEKRHPLTSKSSPLPVDYLKMVEEVFTHQFDEGLKLYSTLKPESRFIASGAVFSDEIVATVSLISEGQLAATTAYASADFDPKASSPTVQELLSACVDALGTVWASLLDVEKTETLHHLAEESMSALENVPFEWTAVDSNQRKIFVKLDKSNPLMDQIANEWLKKNDPNYTTAIEEEEEETEKLFVTGPSELKIQRKKKP